MAITTNLDVAKRGARVSFTIDEPKLAEQFFGFTRFDFGDDPHGPLMVVQVIPPDLDFATHYHDTDYCTLVLKGSLRVGRTWYGPATFACRTRSRCTAPHAAVPKAVRW